MPGQPGSKTPIAKVRRHFINLTTRLFFVARQCATLPPSYMRFVYRAERWRKHDHHTAHRSQLSRPVTSPAHDIHGPPSAGHDVVVLDSLEMKTAPVRKCLIGTFPKPSHPMCFVMHPDSGPGATAKPSFRLLSSSSHSFAGLTLHQPPCLAPPRQRQGDTGGHRHERSPFFEQWEPSPEVCPPCRVSRGSCQQFSEERLAPADLATRCFTISVHDAHCNPCKARQALFLWPCWPCWP